MKKIALMFLALAFLVSCGGKKAPETVNEAPDDFAAFLDYKQIPGGENYCSVFVVSNNFSGEVSLYYGDKKERFVIKPKQIKEFKTPVKLKIGEKAEVKANGRAQALTVKFIAPPAGSLGMCDSKASMFTDNTLFFADNSQTPYMSVFHIAKKKESSFSSVPEPDTGWFAVSFNRKFKISDPKGLVVIKNALKTREMYYITAYYYDMDYNYTGGLMGWNARYMPVK
jgi:hypothetical protein